MKNYQGTKDYLPSFYREEEFSSDMVETIKKKFQTLTSLYGYKRIITPTIEFEELFQRGVGNGSDIVRKEMYSLEDMGGRRITLRPEGTAGVIRAYVQNKLYTVPDEVVKLSYMGSMFRQERPQAGRYREFNQLGLEAIGVNNPQLDAEVISLGWNFFEQLGFQNIDLQINSIGCSCCRPKYKEALLTFLQQKECLCEDCQNRMVNNPLRVLDCKNETCKTAIQNAPLLTDYLCEECATDFEELKETLSILNVPYQVNPSLVRGLDYYTKTTFEFVETSIGAQSTVCGGGRYNGLVEELGGPEKSGIGFAIGLERLMIILNNQNLNPVNEVTPDFYLVWMDEASKKKQIEIAQTLRKRGYSVQLDYVSKKVRSQFKTADRIKAKYAIVLGETELNEGVFSLKNLQNGEQGQFPLENIATITL